MTLRTRRLGAIAAALAFAGSGVALAAEFDGTNGDDALIGTQRHDEIEGKRGNDTILGRFGNDKIEGGKGNDKIDGDGACLAGLPLTLEYCTFGADFVIIPPRGGVARAAGLAPPTPTPVPEPDPRDGNDKLEGDEGDDLLYGSGGNDKLEGDEGDDELQGGFGNDKLEGDDGDDDLAGGPGKDAIKGDDGNDRVFAIDGEKDEIDCGKGFDRVEADKMDVVKKDCERVTRGTPST